MTDRDYRDSRTAGVSPTRWRIAAIVVLAIVTPLGLLTKKYDGPFGPWVRDTSGGAFYVVFWAVLAAAVWPRARPLTVAASVLVATCAIEFAQSWKPAFLEAVRETRVGALVLGTSFAWADFPAYVVGAVLAWLVLLALRRIATRSISS